MKKLSKKEHKALSIVMSTLLPEGYLGNLKITHKTAPEYSKSHRSPL